MPQCIMARNGLHFLVEDYEPPPLGPQEVRVQVEFAAPKHGTERKIMTASPFARKRWDPALRLFRELPTVGTPDGPPPMTIRPVGNMVVGTVIQVGDQVAAWRPGDRVFGYGPICQIHQGPATAFYPLDDLAPADAVCVDPAHVAFVAVRDGNVRVGDDVAVFGLGAIGLMAVQIARAGGANRVLAVDPVPIRRAAAAAVGADVVLDSATGDVGVAIKEATDGHGVDVTVETSGNAGALHQAIRALRQCGTVVHVPFGPHGAAELYLDEEFHHNRITIVGSQAWAGWANPDRSHPLWTHDRAFQATIRLFRNGLISGGPVVTPVVDFADAVDALEQTFADPSESIKLGVRLR